MKKDRRIPKQVVIEALAEKGLQMRRRTLPNGKRAWVVSDGKAFASLRAIYSFYYSEEKRRKDGIGFLLDKFKKGEGDADND